MARRPWPARWSRTIVPVSAMPTVASVTTASIASSSSGAQSVVARRRRSTSTPSPSGTTTEQPLDGCGDPVGQVGSAYTARRRRGSPRPVRRTGRPRPAVDARSRRDVRGRGRRRRGRPDAGRGSPRGRGLETLVRSLLNHRSVLRPCAATRPGTTRRAPSAGRVRRSRPRPPAAGARARCRAARSARRTRGASTDANVEAAPFIATASSFGIASAVRVDDLGAQVDEHGGDVDLDRAHLVAGAAQRRGIRQRVDLRVLPHAPHQRVEDGADRTRVDRAVGVAADPLVDRADVEAGGAADAAQRLPADLVGERAGAAVVEEYDVHLLRTVAGRHPAPRGGVGVHPLAGRGARQQPQEHVEVGERGHDLLDADDGDEHVGQGQAHPPVALRLDHDERAGLGHGEVRAGDRHLRAQELLAQVQPCRRRELGRVVGEAVRCAACPRPPSGRGRSGGSRRGCGGSPAPGCGEGRSSPSWTISSARSVSQAAIPSAASASLSPISWVTIDLTLTTSSTPCDFATSATIRLASSASRAQCTTAPCCGQPGLELDAGAARGRPGSRP